MLKNLAKAILRNRIGFKYFNKFNAVSREMGIQFPDMDKDFMELREKCNNHTMTSPENLYYVHNAIKYIVKNNIHGSMVECGVWKGGNVMMIALTLMKLGIKDRKIYLFDTFEGMSEPTDEDIDFTKNDAKVIWKKSQKEDHNEFCYSPIEEVKQNVYSTGYPKENLIFVKGKVEDTIPGTLPDAISMLRLDTDWYESTYHELTHLFPLLAERGFLIIDDYGHWEGARKAVDQYFQENKVGIFLNRLDYTARAGIKFS